MNDALYQDEPHAGGSVSPPTEVHPLAALFPMLADDDLKSLAEDIKENGLQQPIVIDESGVLIDGRNRLEACLRAGVEPHYLMIDSADAEAFIWSANVKRRQMTKGQIAMVAAMGLILEAKISTKGRPDGGKAAAAKAAGVSPARLTQALAVKDHAPDLVQAVITATMALDIAYDTAKARKKEADWRDNGLAMLRGMAPDLATRVTDGEITVEQARKMLDDQMKAEAAMRDSVLLGVASMTRAACGFEKSEALNRLPVWMQSDDGEEHLRRYFPGGLEEARAKMEAAQLGMDAVKAVLAGMK